MQSLFSHRVRVRVREILQGWVILCVAGNGIGNPGAAALVEAILARENAPRTLKKVNFFGVFCPRLQRLKGMGMGSPGCGMWNVWDDFF
jgi:hypothetical protein